MLLEAWGLFPFLEKPRGVTVSGEVGLTKPDERIYRLHADTFGLTPATTLFIDDSAKNVEGAKGAGWNAVLFTGADRLAEDFREHGVM
ncbi:MAG: HAD-IA family hydrolase [Mesorhizobium sp.]|nr:HAD-IA family hydrolase [Mesorhizobium sp.]